MPVKKHDKEDGSLGGGMSGGLGAMVGPQRVRDVRITLPKFPQVNER